MSHRLDFGSLDLVSADGGDDFWFETLADGFSLGSPQAVKIIRQSLMRDGVDSRISHYENRTSTFQVVVCAPDSALLADGEAALALQVMAAERSALSWTPPDRIGATSVFVVVSAEMEPIYDDLKLVRPGEKQQAYALTLECEPFARSTDPITVTFSPATPTITTLDDGSALTNWSLASGSAPAVLSVATRLGEQAVKVEQSTSDNVSPLVRVAVTPVTSYIAVDMSVDNYAGGLPEVGLVVAGADVAAVASQLQASGYRRYFFAAPTDGVVVLRLKPWRSGFGYTTATSYVGGVYGATSIPATGVLSAEIPGSVRTQGVITVSGAAALGDTMVYCDPTMQTLGWQPDEDSTWPQAPEGSYMIYRKDAASGAGGTFTATAGGQTVSTYLAAGAVPNNSWFPVGRVALGGNRSGRLGTSYSPLTDANTRIFRMAPETSLTYVRGMTDTRLLIDLPSLEFPRGGVWAGAVGSEVSVLDSTDAWEFPTLTPPVSAFFIRAAGDANAVSTATFYPRSHTFNAWAP